MTIIELIDKVGIENTRCQFLPQDMLNVHKGKDHGKITFATDPNVTQGLMDNVLCPKKGMIGVVVWMPADRLPYSGILQPEHEDMAGDGTGAQGRQII